MGEIGIYKGNRSKYMVREVSRASNRAGNVLRGVGVRNFTKETP